MNLPHLKELPLLFPKSLCHLDELIFVLHGCNEVSLEMRIEMNASIQSLKRYRGRHLETWVTIEHLPVAHSERGRCCRMLRSMSSRCLHSFRRRLRQHAYISASSFPKPILLGRSTATSSDESCEDTSSDESCEDTETEVTGHDNMRAHAVGDYVDETKPFPCSYAGCKFFHDAESGYCSKHRWFGVCMKAFALLSALRQYVELASLVHRAALLNALRQYVELASLVHTLATVRFGWYYKMFFLLAVGLYYSSWSAEVRVMVLLAMIFLVPLLLLLWACTASARINRMREISMELEVQTEAVYAKNLRTGLPMFFSWPRNTDIVQPHVSSLQEHYLHARRQLEQFNRELCLPLREFLEDQGCQSYQFLGPALKSILLAHEAVMKHGDPARILDLLHCDVTFDDWHSMVQAWSFLKTRVETDELSGIQIVHARDLFAVAQADLRCAELVFDINGYLATIRFYQRSLTHLEEQVDRVHSLAKQIGLVAGTLQRQQQASDPQPQHPSYRVRVLTFCLRASSGLAAIYLCWQYISFSDNWRTACLLSVPCMHLFVILLVDICCGSSGNRSKLKPTRLLYEKYLGLQGKYYTCKVALQSLLNVMLQAFGRLPIVDGIVAATQDNSRLV